MVCDWKIFSSNTTKIFTVSLIDLEYSISIKTELFLLSACLRLDADLGYEVPVVKVTLGLLALPLLAPVPGWGAPLYVVSLHQLAVIPLPLLTLPLPLPPLPVHAPPAAPGAQVSGELFTGHWLIRCRLPLDWRPVTAD